MIQKVAVIILNWNGYKDTTKCIDSVLAVNYSEVKIIVVDNASDGSEADRLIKKYGHKIIVQKNQKNLGYAGGNNSGVSIAKKMQCDYIMILNNDTEVSEDIIENMLKPFEDLKVALVGASIIDFYDREKVQCRGLTFNIWTGITIAIGLNTNISVKTNRKAFAVSGAGFMIRVSILPGNIIFDPEYFCYYEDTDLNYRIRQLGYKVVVLKDVFIYHKGSASSDKISGFGEYQMIKNRFLIISKHANFLQKIVFLLITFFLYQPFRLIIILMSRKAKNIKFFLKGFYIGFFDFLVKKHYRLDWEKK